VDQPIGSTDPYLGRVINGKYELLERVGVGGFGAIYRARHHHRGYDLGDVVLKFLRDEAAVRPSMRRRFVQEAQAARTLRSPHIVKVFDFDLDEHDVPFMVLEYLDGQPLSVLLEKGPLPAPRALRIGVQIAEALQDCHASGIIHRDLKPSNILLLAGRDDDFVKVIDFGIAMLRSGRSSDTLIGTPQYMAPEQIRRGAIDASADIFALGVVLFLCLSGESPIAARTPAEFLIRNLRDTPRSLRLLAPQMPEALERLLEAMMAKDSRQRPPTMAGVAQRLTAIAADAGWSSEPPRAGEAPPAARTATLQPGAAPPPPQTAAVVVEPRASQLDVSDTQTPTVINERVQAWLTAAESARRLRWMWVAAVGTVLCGAALLIGLALREPPRAPERGAAVTTPPAPDRGVSIDARLARASTDGPRQASTTPREKRPVRDVRPKRKGKTVDPRYPTEQGGL
jgi:serine/threonine protein kinase